jgi:biotin synthase
VARACREIGQDSIPINFLIPIAGTPFEGRAQDLTPTRCLKILSLMRFINPDREIRVAGGRELHLKTLQPMALYAANSIFVTGYLTEPGQDAPDAWKMITDLGFRIVQPAPRDELPPNSPKSESGPCRYRCSPRRSTVRPESPASTSSTVL